MFKRKTKLLTSVLSLLDLALIISLWSLAYYLRFDWINYPPASSVHPYKEYYNATGAISLLGIFSFVQGQLYKPKWLTQSHGEFFAVIRANIVFFILIQAATSSYRLFPYSRLQAVYFILLCLVSMLVLRLFFRWGLVYLHQRGKTLRRVILIGNGNLAKRFYDKLNHHKNLGLFLEGYVSKEETTTALPLSRLGGYAELPKVIEEKGISQIYVTLDASQQSDMREIDDCLAEQMVDVGIVPDLYYLLSLNMEVMDFEGMPVVALRQSPMEGWNRVVKRAFDIFGALVAILLFSPLFLTIPLFIKFSSRGPVFYHQERMGMDGKSFKMTKFRSMRIDAEETTGAVWAKENDTRKTKIGSFLRSTSLDEIPQFFNVLQGSMSLVGPRPERPVFIQEFKKEIPNYMLRHKVKAGITGWAQVNGWRGNTSLEKRIECDIYYVNHWSLGLDIKILFLTFFKGFINRNAY